MADKDDDALAKLIAVVAMAAVVLALTWAWMKATNRATRPLIRITNDAIRKVIDRATEITKEAASEKGVEQ